MNSETIEKLIAIYEKSSGKVIQIHQFVALETESLPDESELASEAIESATSTRGINKTKLAALEVTKDKEQINRGMQFKVDIKRKQLIILKRIDKNGKRKSRVKN